MEQRLEEKLKNELKTLGYYNPEFTMQLIPIDNRNILSIQVYEGYPCRLSQIQVDFRKPEYIEIPIAPNDICSSQNIDTAIKELEENLADEGYNQARISSPEIIYSQETNTAILKISGTIGLKVKSIVNSPIKQAGIIRFITGDDLHDVDPTITDPNTMRTEILRKFRNSGYQDASTKPPRRRVTKNNEVIYQFEVNPGPQYTISEIRFEGLTAISKKEALEIMELYSVLETNPLLTDQVLADAIENLKSHLARTGYWDAKVYYPKIVKSQVSKTAQITFTVKEGLPRIFTSIRFTGNEVFSDEVLRDRFEVQQGEPIAWDDVIAFQRDLTTAYRQGGYLYTTVKIDLIQNRERQRVRTIFSIKITEGQRVKFGKISLNGLRKTKRFVVEREVKILEGEWYSPDLIEQTRESLIDLGLFSFVTVTATQPTDLSKKKAVIPYTINLRESRPGQVSFGPGFSLQDGGRFSVDASYNNILGTGRQIFFTGSFSEEVSQDPIENTSILGYKAGVGYVEPYFLDLPLNGILSFNQYAEAIDQQTEVSTSIQGTLRKRFLIAGKRLDLSTYTLYKVTAESASQDIARLLKSDEIQIREIGAKSILDNRDNISWPKSGYIVLAEAAWADLILGADTKYFHWSTTFNYFFSLSDTFVLATSASLESYSNVFRSETNIDLLPSSERIRSGGAETNRGFQKNELGPAVRYTDSSDNSSQVVKIGGTQATTFKLELRQQLSSSVGISYFVDSSNSYLTENEENLFNEQLTEVDSSASLIDNFRYDFTEILSDPSVIWRKNFVSYGLALSYITPVGSINASYGFPLDRCPQDEDCSELRGKQEYKKLLGGQLQFNVGTYF